MRQILLALFLAPILGMGTTALMSAQASPVVSRLELRDRIVVIESVKNEVLYTISTKDGKVLDAKLDTAQLQAKHPQVYDSVRPAVANEPGSMLMMLNRK